jgi:hypothetical protein
MGANQKRSPGTRYHLPGRRDLEQHGVEPKIKSLFASFSSEKEDSSFLS